ncbi:MAG: hypothetical protein ACPGVN_06930 [Alphaproteobacteria bacterium]
MMKRLLQIAALTTGLVVGTSSVIGQDTSGKISPEDLNASLREMVSGYFALECAKSDEILQGLGREDLTVAMGILDLRAKCYADTGELEKAQALVDAMERAYPESFEAGSAAYYVALKGDDEEASANARQTLLGRHAVLEVKNAGGDHLFLRERVRTGDNMIEVREDLSFLKNGLYGMRYQFRVLEGQIPKHIFILGSSRAAEDEVKDALNEKSDQRYFHLDYYGEQQELGPLKLYKRLPTYEAARDAVKAYVEKGVTPDDYFDSHANIAKFTFGQ